MPNFIKIRQVGAELFHTDWQAGGRTDGQTDMTKLIVPFHNFSNAPKNIRTLQINICDPYFVL
jgi:hypothetical protein